MERQNVTLSLPKALLKKAKTLAVMKDRSLSDLLRETLEDRVKEETGYQRAKDRQTALMEKGFNLGTKGRLPFQGKTSMKDGKVFVDTNVIVYAYDVSAGEKHNKAMETMKDIWSTGYGIISNQVLQEFFVNVTRKIAKPLNIPTAKEIVKDLLKWKTVSINGEVILEAIDIHNEHKYSFRDSAIIAAAIEGGAGVLLSEDLTDKRKIKGIVIKNPFI